MIYLGMDKIKSVAETIAGKAVLGLAGDSITKDKILRQILELAQEMIDAKEGY